MTHKGYSCTVVYVVYGRKVISGVPEELWQRLRVLAAQRNTTISKLVVEAGQNYLDDPEQFLAHPADGTRSFVEAEEYLK